MMCCPSGATGQTTGADERSIDGSHYFAEEMPDATFEALHEFFTT
jgi:hypothetical protein